MVFITAALPLMVFSCRKDTDITTTQTDYDLPTVYVNADLTGQVIYSGEAIHGALSV
ncbi:MAG: hypothetical protein R2795_14160 [Saprospiraceae bacterium]